MSRFQCFFFFPYFSVVDHLSHAIFSAVTGEDACVSGRSLGGSRRPAPGGGGVGSAQPECGEPPRTLSQRYEHVEWSLRLFFSWMLSSTFIHLAYFMSYLFYFCIAYSLNLSLQVFSKIKDLERFQIPSLVGAILSVTALL